VMGRVADAAGRSGRGAQEVTLVVVGKTHPPERLREVVDCGQVDFGENRVQEMLAKVAVLPSTLRWHLVGHLQKNKIRKALPVCHMIHSVDSADLARDIDRVAGELGLFPKVLLEVNVAGEASKFGFAPDALLASLDDLLGLGRVGVEGLMTIPPPVEDPDKARPFFARLRALRDTCQERAGIPLPVLSMGMSGDFEAAIREGATHVRVGTAVFGERG